ncbi:hypothetical protein FPZ49_29225 [Paenibacillus cremeus]|uniref:Uncharacterized protein n=1 Tax=Paenibacillus cremeus TaxID=2163881 RepID=A0A559K0J9_9BACL|nr:hypothetical protein FPZ49_29225 [Paenibacillus cremeus]
MANESAQRFDMFPSLQHVEFMNKKGLITDFLGDTRPLNVLKIGNLFYRDDVKLFVYQDLEPFQAAKK